MMRKPVKSIITVAIVSIAFMAVGTTMARGAAPMGWGVGNSNEYEVSRNADVKHQGETSAEVRSTADAPKDAGSLAQFLRADKYRGKRIRFSGFVKPEAVERWGGLWLRIDTDDKVGVQYGNTQAAGAKGTADWAEHEIVVDVPEDARIIGLGGTLVGKGKLWIDDLSLNIVGNDVPTTGFSVKGQVRKQKPKGPLTAPAEMVNADFEK